jgi:hypothetical protein
VPLAFSEEFLYGLNALLEWPTISGTGLQPDWLLAAIDGGLLLLSLPFVISLWRKLPSFRWHLSAWWLLGASGTVALDWLQEGIGKATVDNVEAATIWTMAEDVLYVALLALALAAVFGLTPSEALLRSGRGWPDFRATVPLLTGLLVAYLTFTTWDASLEQGGSLACLQDTALQCKGAVDPEYFRQLSQIIPVILIGVGLDAAFFRRITDSASQRAALSLTVLILVASEALIISALPKSNEGDVGDVLPGWQEYFVFVFGMQAVAIGLATLAWALIANFSYPVQVEVVEPNQVDDGASSTAATQALQQGPHSSNPNNDENLAGLVGANRQCAESMVEGRSILILWGAAEGGRSGPRTQRRKYRTFSSSLILSALGIKQFAIYVACAG